MTEQSQFRVILVGLTRMAPSLRRCEEIELIRTRTPMDALGELSVCRRDIESERLAVLVAGDALPEDEAPEFVRAAHVLAPGASVLQLAEQGNSADPWDGHLPEASVAGDLLQLLRRSGIDNGRRPDAAAPPEASGTAPAPDGSPADEADRASKRAPDAAKEAAASPAGSIQIDGAAMAERLLSGRDLAEAGVEALRTAVGVDDLHFQPCVGEAPAPTEDAVAVERRGAVFGWLQSAKAPRASLEQCAQALATWLALREQHRQLTEAAFTDSLTGAWNRRYLERYLSSAIERARRDRRDLTVLLFDIDDFKIYNDAYGHAAGDEILRETVRLIQSVIRPTDRVCRLGGDEFVVIFDDPEGPRTPNSHHPMSIADIATRFQRQVCDHRFPKLGAEAPGTLGVSGGIATFPWDGSDPESLLERADQLALESKRQGKNAITLGPGAERVCGRR